FFFSSRRRHTRSDRDWSSDVCSSDLGRIGEHGDDYLTSSRNFLRARGGLRAFLAQLIHGGSATIVHDERIACLQEISRHGFAHDAEADKTDNGFVHFFYLFTWLL